MYILYRNNNKWINDTPFIVSHGVLSYTPTAAIYYYNNIILLYPPPALNLKS